MSIRKCPRCGYGLAKGTPTQYAQVYERIRKDGTGPARYVWRQVHVRNCNGARAHEKTAPRLPEVQSQGNDRTPAPAIPHDALRQVLWTRAPRSTATR